MSDSLVHAQAALRQAHGQQLDAFSNQLAIFSRSAGEQISQLKADLNHVVEGVRDLHIYHLVGHETTNLKHPNRHQFSLRFSSLSPYTIAEILEMSEPQQERFHRAYDIARRSASELC